VFLAASLGYEPVGIDEAVKKRDIVVDEPAVPRVLFEERTDILANDGNRAFQFARIVFRGEAVYLRGDGGHSGVKPVFERIPVADLGATRATYSSRHETSFSDEFGTGRRVRTHIDPIRPAGPSPVYHPYS
jgi:hypothetical protein